MKKLGIIGLMILIGVAFNACEETEERDVYQNEEVVEEYYEEDESSEERRGVVSDNDSVDNRDFIFIYYHFFRESCQSEELKESLMEEWSVTDIITEVSNNNITCNSYGKKNSDECITEDMGYDIGTSCIIGMNTLSIED
jgi:hypothetical protein